MATPEDFVRTTEDLTSGIKTDAVLDPPDGAKGLRVTWIAWDSGFRGSGLQIGDRIVAVDGRPLEAVLQPGKLTTLPGQSAEASGWRALGARPAQRLTLAVSRDGQSLEIGGALLPERIYSDERGRALAPGGPPARGTDGFSEAWLFWYEKIVSKMSQILDGSWERATLNTRKELGGFLEHRERLDLLAKTYPGPFADAMLADAEATIESLRGRQAAAIDLEYRALGARRLELVKAAADKAWDDLQRQIGDQRIPAFPAPALDQRASIAGKLIELPPLTSPRWVSDLGRTFASVIRDDGAYFVQLTKEPTINRFHEALYRFKTQVSETLRERLLFVGAISSDRIMITVDERPVSGYRLDLVAVRAGQDGELVIDLRQLTPEGLSLFAGESSLRSVGSVALSADASPEQVVEAMIQSVKLADEPRWRGLFATWEAGEYDGRALYNAAAASAEQVYASAWEDARKQIRTDVYDVRVHRIEPLRRVIAADARTGLPEIEQVVVWVDHYGLFNGEYRSYNHFSLHRRWALQRVDKGPWRLTAVQSL